MADSLWHEQRIEGGTEAPAGHAPRSSECPRSFFKLPSQMSRRWPLPGPERVGLHERHSQTGRYLGFANFTNSVSSSLKRSVSSQNGECPMPG